MEEQLQIIHEEQTQDGFITFYFSNGAEYKLNLHNFDNFEEAEERAFELYNQDYGIAEFNI